MNVERIVRVPAIDPAVRFVLLQGLTDLDTTARTQTHWDHRTARLLCAHRLAPLALRAIDHHGTEVAAADRSLLTQSATRRIGTTMAVMRGMRVTQELLQVAGIESLGIKGIAMADLDTVATRCFGDADLVVPEEDFLRALDVLVDAGATHELQCYTPRRVRTTWPAINVSDGRLIEADIHRRIAPSVWTRSFGYDEMAIGARPGAEPGTRVVSNAVNLVVVAASIIGDLGTHTPRSTHGEILPCSPRDAIRPRSAERLSRRDSPGSSEKPSAHSIGTCPGISSRPTSSPRFPNGAPHATAYGCG